MNSILPSFLPSFLSFKILFVRERASECEIETEQAGGMSGRGKSRLPAEQGNPMQGLIPGPWDHT